MNKKITLEEIEQIKTQAEDLILKIIEKVEKDTCCKCQSIDFYYDDDKFIEEEFKVDINLRIEHRHNLENDRN